MATRTTFLWTDDLDGTIATEIVRFSVNGTSYEIDLNTAHAAALRGKLAPYVTAGRRTAPGRRKITRKAQALGSRRLDVIAATAEVTSETPTAHVA